MDIGDTTTGKSECNSPTVYKDDHQKGVSTVMEYSDYSTEICDDVLVHEDLLKSIGEKMPCEEELYDLAELFKICLLYTSYFGRNSRSNAV